jgi:syntaxin 16
MCLTHSANDFCHQLFIESKKLVETIDTSKEPTSQEEVMKRNMKISLVNELNDLSIQFRNEQQEYLKNMERYKANQRANKVQYEESYEDMEPEERQRLMELEQKLESDPGFTDEQIRQMIQNEESIMRRDRELREILKSIVELNELFKEFSSLVVEQGTLLDRIDYNIEAACSFVKEGNKNLISAEKYQKMSRMTLCLLLLIVFFLAIGLFVALKLFLKFGLSVNLPSLHIFQ